MVQKKLNKSIAIILFLSFVFSLFPAGYYPAIASEIISISPVEPDTESLVCVGGKFDIKFSDTLALTDVADGGITVKIGSKSATYIANDSTDDTVLNVSYPEFAINADTDEKVTVTIKYTDNSTKIFTKNVTIKKLDPSITQIINNQGNPITEGSAGAEVFIRGKYFLQDTSKLEVFFGSAEAQVLSVGRDAEGEYIRCVVPEKAEEDIDNITIKVINKYTNSVKHTSNLDKTFRYIVLPQIFYIDGSNYIESNQGVTIIGKNFPVGADLKITIGSVTILGSDTGQISTSTESKIVFKVPESAGEGPLDFTITDATNANITYTVKNFFIKDIMNLKPKLPQNEFPLGGDTNPFPNVGNPVGNDVIKIKGENFITVNKDDIPIYPKVYFIWNSETNEKEYVEASVAKLDETDSSILAVTTPSSNGKLGEVKIKVLNPDLDGIFADPTTLPSTLSDDEVTYTYKSTIGITAVTPNMGSVNGGYEVTITGINFKNLEAAGVETGIWFGPYKANFDTVKIKDEGKMIIEVPQGWVPQSGEAWVDLRIEMKNSQYTEIALLKNAFKYVAPESAPELITVYNDLTKTLAGPLAGGVDVTAYARDFNYYESEPGDQTKDLNGIYFEKIAPENKMTIKKITSELLPDPVKNPEDGTVISQPDTYYIIKGILPALETEGLKDVYLVNADGAITVLPNFFNYKKSRMRINGVSPSEVDLGGILQILGFDFKEDELIPQVIFQDLDENDEVRRTEEIPSQYVQYDFNNIDGTKQEYLYVELTSDYVTEGKKKLILKNSFGEVEYKYIYINPRSFVPIVDHVINKETKIDENDKEYFSYTYTDKEAEPIQYSEGSVIGNSELILLGNNFTTDTKIVVDEQEATDISTNMYNIFTINLADIAGTSLESEIESLNNPDFKNSLAKKVSIKIPNVTNEVKHDAVIFKNIVPNELNNITEYKVLIFRNTIISAGSTIKISDYEFTSDYLKDINKGNLRTVRYVSGKVLLCTTYPGVKDIVVQNKGDGEVTLTLDESYKYYSNPSINNIMPNKITTNGQNIITMTGEQFYKGIKVGFFDKDGKILTGKDIDGNTINLEVDAKWIDNSTIRFRVPKGLPVTDADDKVIIKVKNQEENWQGEIDTLEVVEYGSVENKVTLESMNPKKGPIQGETLVNVTGTGFDNNTDIYFGYEKGEIQALNIEGTEMVVKIPPNEAGFYPVTIVNEENGYAFNTEDDYFEYLEPGSIPEIESIFPNEGPKKGGTRIIMKGKNFQKGLSVFIGSVEHQDNAVEKIDGHDVKVAQVIDQNTIQVTTKGENKVGPYDVKIVNPDTGSVILKDGFYYKMPDSNPTIQSVTPKKGSKDGGTLVTIEGQDFRKGVKVFFDNLLGEIQGFDEASGKIWVTAPAHPVGIVDITVQNTDGGTAQWLQDFEYLIPESNPKIEKIEPNKGSTAGGTKVIITGNDFRDDVEVYFGPNKAGSVTKIRYDQLEVITPVGVKGKADVTVINNKNENFGTVTARDAFEYVTSRPVIHSIEPNIGSYKGGTEVTILGEDFSSLDVKVFIGENEATVIEAASDSIFIKTPPSGDDTNPNIGEYDVKVINNDGEEAILEKGFKYLYPDSTPEIYSVTPTAGPTIGGMPIKIIGKDFREDIRVVMRGKEVTDLQLKGETEITCRIPANPEGTVRVIAINQDGGVASWGDFTYTEALSEPVIKEIKPNQGSINGETTVSIIGNDFRNKKLDGTTENPKVYFGNKLVNPEDVNYIKYNEITVKTPPHEEGTVDVIVVNPDYGIAEKKSGFTYMETSKPIIKSITPNTGPAAGDTPITIKGSKFEAGAKVTIGDKEAQKIKFIDENTIEAVTPPGESGKQEVKVINPDGGISNIEYFTYRGKPEDPSGLNARAMDYETIELSWNEVDFANNYEIFIRESGDDDYTFLEQVNANDQTFIDDDDFVYYVKDLEPDTKYYFKVRAINEIGFSLSSNTDSATTDDEPRDYDEEHSAQEKKKISISTGYNCLDVVVPNYKALKNAHYLIDLKDKKYDMPEQKISFSFEALSEANTNILVSSNKYMLDFDAKSILPTEYWYKNFSSREDVFSHLIIKDLGQKEAESAMRSLPRGARIISSVMEISLTTQDEKEKKNQNKFFTIFKLALKYNSGAVKNKNIYLYTYNLEKNKWDLYSIKDKDGLYLYIGQPGKYMLVAE